MTTKTKREPERLPARERVFNVSCGAHYNAISLEDYDGEEGLADPDFETEMQQVAPDLDPGEAAGDPIPLDLIFR